MTASRVLPWAWAGLVGGAFLAGIAIDLPSDLADGDVQVLGQVTGTLVAFTFPVAGALILSRHPRHPVGWILSLSGVYMFAEGLDSAIDGWVSGAMLAWSTWVSQVFFAPSFLTLITLLPLLFPTGSLVSSRWRWALGCSITGLAGLTLANALDPALLADEGMRNPIAGPGPEGFYDGPFMLASGVFFIIGVLSGVASLVVRYRRARDDERHQIRWLLLAMIVAVIGWFVAIGLEAAGARHVSGHVFGMSLMGLPIGIAVAVLKYRLYDIDVVISKTVVFAGLAGFITAIYVSIVVGLGSLLGAGDEPNLALSIVATAVVAVAFQPVRERLTRLANRLVFGKRATPYEVLSRFSEHLGEVAAADQTLGRMARLLVEGTGAARAQVWLRSAVRLEAVATWPAHASDSCEPEHLVEVVHEGEMLGALSVDKQRGETLTPSDIKLVEDLAAQAGLVLRNLRLTEDLRGRIVDLQASRQRLVSAQDQERRRLERDLHDGAQRQLLALKTRLHTARAAAEREQAVKAAQVLDQLLGDADDAVSTLRELAHGIYPPVLAAEGLAGALTAQASKAAVTVTVEADRVGRYSQDVEAAVYFCVLEAINNAAKYAHATQVVVRLTDTEGQLTFEVSDDGTGFDPDTTARGHGLTNMTDRLDALAGRLTVDSVPGSGTTIAGRLPIENLEVSA